MIFFPRFDVGPSPDELIFLLMLISGTEKDTLLLADTQTGPFELPFVLLDFAGIIIWSDWTVQSLLRAFEFNRFLRDEATSSVDIVLAL